jgi:hypothetical protein
MARCCLTVRRGILSRRCAAAVGLIDRGALRPGFAADITILDPASIADRATFNEPRRYPAGITHVIVTGVAVIAGGVHARAPPGRLLRRAATRSGGGPQQSGRLTFSRALSELTDWDAVSALAPIATVARSHATPTAIGYRPNQR